MSLCQLLCDESALLGIIINLIRKKANIPIVANFLLLFAVESDNMHFLSVPDAPETTHGSVSTSAKLLSLNLKNQYNQKLEQLLTSTAEWPLSPNPVDCAESYLNMLNLENSSKPAALFPEQDPFIRANGTVDNTESSNSEIVQFTSRNSADVDDK